MQGKSLVPILDGTSPGHREDVYCEYLNAMPWHTEPKAFASMVRTKEWKLVVSHSGNGEGELYDLQKDPEEQTNLFSDSAYSQVRAQLTSRLLERWARMVDPLPERKSDW